MFRNLIFIVTICVMNSVYASSKIGIDWFSISEQENGDYLFQVSHVFLGAGSRQAYFFFEACEGGGVAFQLSEQGFTQFESKCVISLSDKSLELFAELYYKKDKLFTFGGRKTPAIDKVCTISKFDEGGVAHLYISGVQACGDEAIKVYEIKSGKEFLVLNSNLDILYGDQFVYSFKYREAGYSKVIIEYGDVEYFFGSVDNKRE